MLKHLTTNILASCDLCTVQEEEIKQRDKTKKNETMNEKKREMNATHILK